MKTLKQVLINGKVIHLASKARLTDKEWARVKKAFWSGKTQGR